MQKMKEVIAGNLVGCSVLVALVYYVIYRHAERASNIEPARKASDVPSIRAE